MGINDIWFIWFQSSICILFSYQKYKIKSLLNNFKSKPLVAATKDVGADLLVAGLAYDEDTKVAFAEDIACAKDRCAMLSTKMKK
jgi:hypothetical protein